MDTFLWSTLYILMYQYQIYQSVCISAKSVATFCATDRTIWCRVRKPNEIKILFFYLKKTLYILILQHGRYLSYFLFCPIPNIAIIYFMYAYIWVFFYIGFFLHVYIYIFCRVWRDPSVRGLLRRRPQRGRRPASVLRGWAPNGRLPLRLPVQLLSQQSQARFSVLTVRGACRFLASQRWISLLRLIELNTIVFHNCFEKFLSDLTMRI